MASAALTCGAYVCRAFDDPREALNLETRPSNQRAINAANRHEFGDVVGCDAAAVEDAHGHRFRLLEYAGDLPPDERDRLFSVLGSRRRPRADRPHRLVG